MKIVAALLAVPDSSSFNTTVLFQLVAAMNTRLQRENDKTLVGANMLLLFDQMFNWDYASLAMDSLKNAFRNNTNVEVITQPILLICLISQ